VLDLGKVESGSVVLDVAPVDIGRTLEDARMLVRERSRKSGIRVTVVVERGVPVVEADARKVRQVVTNLLANAVKFTPRNGRVTVTASPAPGGGVRVAVADTGVGIAPDDIERIFEQFEQVAGVSGAASEGTGLGLAVARRFVDRHGGRLWAQSAPGRGSTFVFELPARPPRGVTSTRPRGAAAPPVEHPIDAYEGFLVPGSRRNRELIAGTGRAFAVIAAALTIVFAVITPGAGHARVVVGAVAFLALLFGVLVGRFGSSASVLALESLPVLGTLAISALAWLAAPFAGLISMAYVWTTLTRFALWDRGRAVLQIVLTAACFGIVLAGHPELGDRPARWLGLLFLLVVNGLLARWIILKLRSVAMAERDARLTAEQVQAQLAATSEHKSDFLASMSHELRTPLNAIIGFSDVLREGVAGPLDERQTAYVDDIADAGRHLLALINDILDLAKLEAGQLQLQREPVAVSSLVEHAVVRARPGALEREVTLRSTCPPDAVIDADAARLEQVLASVVDNAVKFTADGGAVDVRVEAHGDEVRIAVSDTGIGIHPANRRSIFDAFHVAAREGTGLGLALAKGLVELHGGRIWVESEPGVGSTFTVAMAARHLVDAS
jgi:signal transduction histidine kinase